MSADGNGFTVKDMVLEIRDTVQALDTKLDRIDREGSIGTKAQLTDHEGRIRINEGKIYELEEHKATRSDVHKLKSDVVALRLQLADRPEQVRQFRQVQKEVESLKLWRVRMLGALGILAFIIMPFIYILLSFHLWG